MDGSASPAQPKRASVHLSDGGVKGATNILDTILNAIPAIDEGLAIAFQTKLYSSIIAHVDAMSSVQLVAYLATYEGMFQHLCEVAMRMSDCVVNGTFNGPATAVWGLQVRILVDMERHASLDMVKTLQKVHRSLNVCIVSELMQTSVTSTALRDVLDDVLDIQNVVFQPSNTDVEFLETLTKILLDVLENTRAAARDGAFNLWKLMFLQKVEEMRSICTVLGEHNEVVDLYDRIFEYLMSNALDQLSAFLATHHSHRTGLTRNSSGGWLHYSKKVWVCNGR
ncbi:hypothetical protein SARC_12345 [Sphaeroforma arctica JP610]|uniref:Uncharacterized protein n=1 Tax=Sphaeroforma arctica JP610 TaxID=667725 RepID=A0A0L0FF92_9EUKA|nr:hypothetical protein SARC_12345 [Sphaeroforma arctica JP610]KNC75121.1 hypothetical protein SARC_12345 [Sphaeroforma arctica JP610]|eukprot:XP_014149023.1 hypothetical protein SARC_12345 [Sphaeroforma arctica JP610]